MRNAFRLSLLALFALSLSACAGWIKPSTPVAGAAGEFRLYLLDDPALTPDPQALSEADLATEPLLTDEDILAYYASSHAIDLSSQAMNRLSQPEIIGMPFVVCLDRRPIYTGTFVAPFFSRTFEGPVILVPLLEEEGRIRIQLGYPDGFDFSGRDPRSDPAVLEALRQSGKLR